MITRRQECDETKLRQMLADTLTLKQQQAITQHLDHCAACQEQLDQLVGEPAWWHETRETLWSIGELQIHADRVAAGQERESRTVRSAEFDGGHAVVSNREQPQHWVLSLLQPSQDPEALGSMDEMPVHDVVGQGGMGVVLKARDGELHRYLAIKLLSPMLSGNGASRERFFREAQAAAAIVHPNIVPIYAVSGNRSLPYIVMPYIAGGNLQQHLDREGPLPIERVLSLGLQVAEALVAAHAQGIIHRDIKPANLMLDDGGFRVMLTDFGLARALDDATLTGSGMITGTPQFMSPEQARGRALDERTDLYSLGAVLYALATGHAPFHGQSTLEILRRINEESPIAVTELNEAYPIWFERLVAWLMEKDADRRIGSAETAASLLRQCLAHARSPHKVDLPRELQRRLATLFPRGLIASPTGVFAMVILSTLSIATCVFAAILSGSGSKEPGDGAEVATRATSVASAMTSADSDSDKSQANLPQEHAPGASAESAAMNEQAGAPAQTQSANNSTISALPTDWTNGDSSWSGQTIQSLLQDSEHELNSLWRELGN